MASFPSWSERNKRIHNVGHKRWKVLKETDSFLRIRITYVTNVRDWVFFFFSWDQSTNYSGKVVVQFHDRIREKDAFKKWNVLSFWHRTLLILSKMILLYNLLLKKKFFFSCSSIGKREHELLFDLNAVRFVCVCD